MGERIDIPEKHQEFCKAVGRLCREYKLSKFHGQFGPGYRDDWHHEVQFSWETGRHEADVGKIHINSTIRVNTSIDVPAPPITKER